jgi:hypothetical protein
MCLMLDVVVIAALISGLLITPYLIYRNYQLEKRWRSVRYCWQAMSDFAAELDKEEDGTPGLWWQEVANEHIFFLKAFGVRTLSVNDLHLYESELTWRDIPPLNAHLP